MNPMTNELVGEVSSIGTKPVLNGVYLKYPKRIVGGYLRRTHLRMAEPDRAQDAIVVKRGVGRGTARPKYVRIFVKSLLSSLC